MKFEDLQYFKLNRSLLFLIGIGTEHDSWLIKTFRFFYFLVLCTGVPLQLVILTTPIFVLNNLLMYAPNILLVLIAVLKYSQFCCKVGAIRLMKECVTEDWRNLRDIGEIRIMKEYARRTQLMTMAFTFVVYAGVIAVIISVVMPVILDVILPLNQSREVDFFMHAEYYFSTTNSKLFLAFMFTVIAFSTSTTIAATETMAALTIEHICALMKIASYRIQQALHPFALPNPEAGCYAISHRKIAEAVQIHNTAINFVELIRSTLLEMYFVLLIIAIAAISTNLYRLSQALANHDRNYTVVLIMVMALQIGYLILTNYAGQQVIDHNSGILEDIYVTVWYRTPVPIQKLLLLIMMRSMKQCTLIIGGIFIPSFEGFSTLCSMSFSYFTIIYSMQS